MASEEVYSQSVRWPLGDQAKGGLSFGESELRGCFNARLASSRGVGDFDTPNTLRRSVIRSTVLAMTAFKVTAIAGVKETTMWALQKDASSSDYFTVVLQFSWLGIRSNDEEFGVELSILHLVRSRRHRPSRHPPGRMAKIAFVAALSMVLSAAAVDTDNTPKLRQFLAEMANNTGEQADPIIRGREVCPGQRNE
ncbi:hypothetical protein ON010_g3853 [Phytophthora cinnamomi]|nr:hypothetical protein ON010_g3853 [Phytophthora cinnamomi]